jgi:hypothetical protein
VIYIGKVYIHWEFLEDMKKKALRKAIGVGIFVVLVILSSFLFFGGPTGNVVSDSFGKNYDNDDFVLSFGGSFWNGNSLEINYKVVELGGVSRDLEVSYEVYSGDTIYAKDTGNIILGASDIGNYKLLIDFKSDVPDEASLILEVSEGDKRSVVVESVFLGSQIGFVTGNRFKVSQFFFVFVLSLGVLFYVTRMVVNRNVRAGMGEGMHDRHLISVHR